MFKRRFLADQYEFSLFFNWPCMALDEKNKAIYKSTKVIYTEMDCYFFVTNLFLCFVH